MDIDAFSRIIDEIYDLTADRDGWIRLLDRIAQACDAGSASIASGNRADPLSVLCSVVSAEEVEEYRTHWVHRDPSMALLRQAPPGQITSLEEIGGLDRFKGASVYDGFWGRTGHSAHHLRRKLHQDADGWMAFAVHARKSDDEILNSTLAGFDLFSPHLARAAEIQRRLTAAVLSRKAANVAPGRPGLFMVNEAGRPLFLDSMAEDIFDRTRALRLQPDGLAFRAQADATAFRALLASCHAKSPMVQRGGRMQTSGMSPLTLDLMPISRQEAVLGLDFVAEPGGIVLVVIDDPAHRTERLLRRLRTRFGLTHAEARVALESVSAQSRTHLAARMGLAESTVRTHLTRVYEKTGTRRQAHLVQVVSAFIAGLDETPSGTF